MKKFTSQILFLIVVFTVVPALAEMSEADPAKFRLTLPRLDLEPKNVPEKNRTEAEEYYQRALASARNRQGYNAMRLIVKTLEANPDHESARKVLNYRLHDGRWRTDWEIRQLERGCVDHPTFGWMPSEFADRYENGQRYYAREKRWISAEEDARLHFEMQNAWVISTEHYDVRTNHSWEEGVRASRKLEHLNRAWRMLFFNMFYTEDRLARLILEPPRGPEKKPRHRVLVYRNQGDYNANLKKLEPQIEVTNGFFYPGTGTAYFFPVAEDMDDFMAETTMKTLFHEAVHQLFQEAKSSRNQMPPKTNFWVTEGVAMLFETFKIEEDRYVLGDLYDTRLYAAKRYKIEDNFFITTTRLTRFGAPDFPKQLTYYAQSAALTHLLMFVENGRDRDALLELLRKTYDGSARPETLSKLIGRPYEQLDREYLDFLKTVPE